MVGPTDRKKPAGRAKGFSAAGKKATLYGPDLTWRLLAENIPNLVILASPEGTIQFINHTISGRPVEEVLGKSIYDLVEEQFHNTVRQAIQQVLKTGDPGTYQVHATVRGGDPRWFETHIGSTKYGGKATGLVLVSTDITEHRLTDEKMRQSEERYHAVFEHSVDGILLIDTDGRWSDFNTAAHEHLGYTRDEFKDLRIADVEVAESQEQIESHIAKITREGYGTFETKHRTKQGEIRDVVITARTITVSGKLIFVSVWRDITDQKQAAEKRRQSEERYRAIFEQSADGIVLIDTDGRWSDFNTAAHEHLGYTRDEFKDLLLADVEVIESREQIESHIAKITREGRGTFETKHRTKQGEIRDVVVTVRGITVSGEPMFVAIWRDITNERQAEEVLRESEDKYRNLFAHANDAIFVADIETGVFLDANSQAERLTGRSRDEIIGMHQSQLHPPEKAKQYKAQFHRHVESSSTIEHETEVIRKDGTIVLADISASVVQIGGKKVIHGIFRDITERKRAEEALRQSQKALQAKNVALREVLGDIQEEKNEMARQIMANVDKVISPMLHDLERDLSPRQHKRIAVLTESLKEITSPLSARLSKGTVRLTPIELRICNLIRSGMSTKDISELQHVSAATVRKHRENIRRKLGLTGRNVNLANHLDSLLSQDALK